MNKLQLLWIIPLVFISGMLVYALLDNHSEIIFFDLIETCLEYETNMDFAIINVQGHCLIDDINYHRNTLFCDEFMNQSKILSLYNFKT